MSPVIFINCFEVPVGREEEFFGLWREVNDYMRGQPGYISHRLHRSLATDARYRFVNVVNWESPEHWRAAHNEGFRRLVDRPEWRDFTTMPALFEVVDEKRV